MTQSTTMTARTPEDVLAVVPVVLGFEPHDSLVMLTFGADPPFHARVDLPDRRSEVPDLVAVAGRRRPASTASGGCS